MLDHEKQKLSAEINNNDIRMILTEYILYMISESKEQNLCKSKAQSALYLYENTKSAAHIL